MDQTNSVGGIDAQSVVLSALGPGGLSRRDRPRGFEVRANVHSVRNLTGRICPIETPGRSEHRSHQFDVRTFARNQ